MSEYNILWSIFVIMAVILFSLDFKLSAAKPHEITLKESLIMCMMWISFAMIYGILIWHYLGASKFAEYLTAYVVEYSLSIDNMFVFLMIFSYFGVEKKYQPKVLVIGILSAVIMRMFFIFVGVEAVKRFSWLLYIFAVILIYSGFKMFSDKVDKIELDRNLIFRFINKKYIPIDMDIKNGGFWVIKNGRIVFTSLLAVLAVIETTDLVFAVDSIPAVLSISRDRLVVYSSNIFAVIGLRSLYFSLAALNDYFRYLKQGVSVVLIYIGLKMLLSKFVHIQPFTSLIIVLTILLFSMIISVIKKIDYNG
ncbi:MAG: TerC/Alx family metal homeostasis membrane protein [Elusimicrobiales bacterium]